MKSVLLCACIAAGGIALAQTGADKPAFEVASIKATDPNPENRAFIGMSADRAMVKYTNITLRDCIRGAYRARDFQISGPDWMTKARFEIDAKLPSGASSDQIPEMLQALLAERFKLEIHRETKEQNVYALLVGKGGPKLKAPDGQPDLNTEFALGPDGRPRPAIMYALNSQRVVVTAPSASIAALADNISRFTARPIIDMTGIEGQYQFNLFFAPDGNPGNLPPTGATSGPNAPQVGAEPIQSLFDAVQRYGFRLEARKAPVEMFVVTHVEKTPTDN